MSTEILKQAPPIEEDVSKKSEDKKEIELEEEERMIKEPPNNEEKGDAKKEEQTEEVKEQGTPTSGRKHRMPNIKIPEFLRRKSKERTKEKEANEPEATKELLPEGTAPTEEKKSGFHGIPKPKMPKVLENIKVPNPFAKKAKEKESGETGGIEEKEEPKEELTKEEEAAQEKKEKTSAAAGVSKRATQIMESIRVPLVGLFSRKPKEHKDPETGEAGTELLEAKGGEDPSEKVVPKETVGKEQKSAATTETEGTDTPAKIMEEENNHKPSTEKIAADPEKISHKSGNNDVTIAVPVTVATDTTVKQPWQERIRTIPLKYIIIGASVLLLLLLIIIIAVLYSSRTRTIDFATLRIRGAHVETITSCGVIEGLVQSGAFAFRGVPYAVPPVGRHRWLPAKTHDSLDTCWNGTLLAHNATVPCWQIYRNGSYDGAEDCLTLEVFTPKVGYDSPLPVIVFIGGETLDGGQSSTLRPTPALAKKKQVVFVNVNIRRSVLGFLALEILSKNTYPFTSGNYGFSDLIASLKWVQRNIEHFGGNKKSVTVLGHLSGATLVTALTASRRAKGLFQKAWVSSGSATYTNQSLQDSERENVAFLNSVECPGVECLYSKTPEELLESLPDEWRSFTMDLPSRGEHPHAWAIVDLRFMTDTPVKVWERKHHNDVPIVFGSTAQGAASKEMLSFLNWNMSDLATSYIQGKLETFSPALVRDTIERYRATDPSNWFQYISMVSDIRTICPLIGLAKKAAEHFESKIYSYVAIQRKWGPFGDLADSNSDIEAIFDQYNPKTNSEKDYVKHMQNLFYSFINTGEMFSDFPADRGLYLIRDAVQTAFHYPNCDFWQMKGITPTYARLD